MRAITCALLFASGLLVACGPGGRNPGGDDDDDVDAGNGSGTGDGGTNSDNCSEEAKLVYVVDSNDTFSKFDPMTKTFTDLGQLDCNTGGSPFSMSVDRDAFAWILFTDDSLHRMDVKDLSTCTRTSWSSPNNMRDFGMGFSTDAVGGTEDTLFIAGGSSGPTTGNSNLVAVDTGPLTAQGVGSIQGWPELTGTGNAELWGFFPSATTTPRISKIDKTSGAMMTNFPIGQLSGEPRAWAFAAWGGDFWVFLQKDFESSTRIYQVDGMTGAVEGTTMAGGRRIVGAGVSTCAPVIVQ